MSEFTILLLYDNERRRKIALPADVKTGLELKSFIKRIEDLGLTLDAENCRMLFEVYDKDFQSFIDLEDDQILENKDPSPHQGWSQISCNCFFMCIAAVNSISILLREDMSHFFARKGSEQTGSQNLPVILYSGQNIFNHGELEVHVDAMYPLDWTEALAVLFAIYWNYNITYCSKIKRPLAFLERCFVGLNVTECSTSVKNLIREVQGCVQ